ncbi:DUF2141 domain-containing protein [Piscinibacter terrae]|uniref:DUF2141 domain-containing protein n=1 Tax=Piscinibacter terrae TaxID=2496871 RepID=A0A3N7HNH7_9BURK|nr:DUF2141 domain-containing protein [Albitalea terrae]RQP22656.1 DUF2141 domain-containing protein [Albitalea terrae]
MTFEQGMNMKRKIRALAACAFLALPAVSSLAADLDVVVENIRNANGNLIIALYSPDTQQAFPAHPDKALRKIQVPAKEGKQTVHVENVSEGNFAVTIVHDENGNGTMDHNFLGMPREGFGFSNNPKVRFSLPSFEAASFHMTSGAKEISISLTYW